MSDFAKMTVSQLKAELKQRDLEADGKKPELIARLEAHEKQDAEKMATESEIIEQIDSITADTKENGAEPADEEKPKEEPMEDEDAEKKGEDEKAEDEKAEGDESEAKKDEEKEEEEKKDLGPDYTKTATGFILALETGSKIVIPTKDIFKNDLKMHSQPKTVLVNPISIDDISSGLFQPFFESCIHFTVTFQQHNHEKTKSDKGYIEFIFASSEQAIEQAELMSQLRDDIDVKHLTLKDKREDFIPDVPKDMMNSDDHVLWKRYLYIGNLPPTATDQGLQELFPDAERLAVIHNEDGLPKGYALAEMLSEEAVDRATKMYMNVAFEERTLTVIRAWQKVPKGLLDCDSRNDLLSKVKKCRQKIRAKGGVDAFAKRKLDNEMIMLKTRLDKDCKVREELGLPVPPDVVRREELLKEIEEKKKDDSSSSDKKTTPAKKTLSRNSNSVPYKRPGQNRRGAPALMRGGRAGGYGGNQSYGNQGYSNQAYSNQGYANQGYGGGYGGSGGGNRGTGEGGYTQAVEMLMQVSKMLGRGQSAGGQQQTGGAGYGGGYGGSSAAAGYGGSGYSSGSAGYGYGTGGMQRGGKRTAEDQGFGGGKRGSGFKSQRRW